MIAAIYARKSKKQEGVPDEDSNVEMQVASARKFAAEQNWKVVDAYIFKDDGISGAEFGEKRPAFNQMMNALAPKAPFQVLIVSEQKSIGREMNETGFVIKQLAQAGVEVFECTHKKSLTPKNVMDKIVGALQGFGGDTTSTCAQTPCGYRSRR